MPPPSGNGAPGWWPGDYPYPGPGGGAAGPGWPQGGGEIPSYPGAGGKGLPTGVPTVTEAECLQREASARRAEESKAIKYAVISAVVSGLVGVAIGKLV